MLNNSIMRMKMRNVVLLCLSLLFATSFWACGNNGCEETRETYLDIQLKKTSGIAIQRLNVWGIFQGALTHPEVTDSLYADSLMTVLSNPTNLELILNPNATETDIRLQMTIGTKEGTVQTEDTLHVEYESFPYFIDMECGCSVFFRIKQVESTQNLFKNIKLTRESITNEENTNLVIEY